MFQIGTGAVGHSSSTAITDAVALHQLQGRRIASHVSDRHRSGCPFILYCDTDAGRFA